MDWTKEVSFYEDFPNLKKSAYNSIANIINNSKAVKILDFGCGDGKQIPYISQDKSISLFDINKDVVNLAVKNNKERDITTFETINDIPNNEFDILICSLVLMCIDNRNEYLSILKTFKKVLKPNSILLVLVTHPAFREKEFSYYKAIFDKPFNYFEEGSAFKVKFKNIDKDIIITDYHWSLSFTINSLIKNGFLLDEFIEMNDSKSDTGYENKNYSPYLLLKLKS